MAADLSDGEEPGTSYQADDERWDDSFTAHSDFDSDTELDETDGLINGDIGARKRITSKSQVVNSFEKTFCMIL